MSHGPELAAVYEEIEELGVSLEAAMFDPTDEVL